MASQLMRRVSPADITPAAISAFYQQKLTPLASFAAFLVYLSVPIAVIGVFAVSCNFDQFCGSKRDTEAYLRYKERNKPSSAALVRQVLKRRPVNELLYGKCWIFGLALLAAQILLSCFLFAVGSFALARPELDSRIVSAELSAELSAQIAGLGFYHGQGGAQTVSILLQRADRSYRALFQDYAYHVQATFDVSPQQSQIDEVAPIIALFAKMQGLLDVLDGPAPPGFVGMDYSLSQKLTIMRAVTKAFLSRSVKGFYTALHGAGIMTSLFGANISLFDKNADKEATLQVLGLQSADEEFGKSEFYGVAQDALVAWYNRLLAAQALEKPSLEQALKAQENSAQWKQFTKRLDVTKADEWIVRNRTIIVRALIMATAALGCVVGVAFIVTYAVTQCRQEAHAAKVLFSASPAAMVFAALGLLSGVLCYYLHVQGSYLGAFFDVDYVKDSAGFELLRRHFQDDQIEVPLEGLGAQFVNFEPRTVSLPLSTPRDFMGAFKFTARFVIDRYLGFGRLQVDVPASVAVKQDLFGVATAQSAQRVSETRFNTNKRTKDVLDSFTFDGSTFESFAQKVDDQTRQALKALDLFAIGVSIDAFEAYFRDQIGISGQSAPKMHVLQPIAAAFAGTQPIETALGVNSGLSDLKSADAAATNLHLLLKTYNTFTPAANPSISAVFAALRSFSQFVACMEGGTGACAAAELESGELANADVETYLEDVVSEQRLLFNVSRPISVAMEQQVNKPVDQWDSYLQTRFQQRYGRAPEAADYQLRLLSLLTYDPNGVFAANNAKTMFEKLILAARILRHAGVLVRAEHLSGLFSSTTSNFSKINNYIDVVAVLAADNVGRMKNVLRNENYRALYGSLQEILVSDFRIAQRLCAYGHAAARGLISEPSLALSRAADAAYVCAEAAAILLLLASFTALFQREALARHLARFEKLEAESDFCVYKHALGVVRIKEEHRISQKAGMMLVPVAEAECPHRAY